MSGRGLAMAGGGGLLVGAALMAGFAPAAADPDRTRIEVIVRDYILAHPEIIPEAMKRLRERDTADKIAAQRSVLEKPFAGAWAGAADGDVTVVEFFDYACGYCRTSVKDVDRLLAEDKRVRIVFRELPILGETSDQAARVSLSAAKQGRFLAFHRAMYAGARPSAAAIADARAKAGLAAGRVTTDAQAADVRAEIETNLALAQALEISGTPSFVIGDQLLGGAVGYDALKAAVAKARAERK